MIHTNDTEQGYIAMVHSKETEQGYRAGEGDGERRRDTEREIKRYRTRGISRIQTNDTDQ